MTEIVSVSETNGYATKNVWKWNDDYLKQDGCAYWLALSESNWRWTQKNNLRTEQEHTLQKEEHILAPTCSSGVRRSAFSYYLD